MSYKIMYKDFKLEGEEETPEVEEETTSEGEESTEEVAEEATE